MAESEKHVMWSLSNKLWGLLLRIQGSQKRNLFGEVPKSEKVEKKA